MAFYGVNSNRYVISSSVVVAAASYDLTTLVDVKAELDLANSDALRDNVLKRYIKECSAQIANFCNRKFVAETIKDSFYPQADPPTRIVTGGVDPIQLSVWPVVSITSVEENGTALVADTDFMLDVDKGQVTRLDSNGYPQRWPVVPIVVTYVGGFSIVPDDVAGACISFVKFRFFSRKRDPSLKGETVVGVYEAQYLWGTGPGGQGDIPAQVESAIARYRVPVTA